VRWLVQGLVATFLAAAVLCVGPGYAAVGKFVIPWGDGPGRLTLDPVAGDDGRRAMGPTSFRVGPDGGLFLLDAHGGAVERFDRDGRFQASYRIPRVDQHDVELRYTDLAVDGAGRVYVLEAEHRMVLRLIPGQAMPDVIRLLLPRRENTLLLTIDVTPDDTLLVLDAFDHTLYRLSMTGRVVATSTCHEASFMAPDDRCRYLFVEAATDSSFKSFKLGRRNPFSAAPDYLATLESGSEFTTIHVRGVDARDRAYVEVARGPIEAPIEHRVLVYSPEGVRERAFPVPGHPARLDMTRERAVSRAGDFYVLRASRRGLAVYRVDGVSP